MNWDVAEGNWKQFKGLVKDYWGRLTDDDVDRIEGRRERLLGNLQEIYGVSREEAERQIRDFERVNQDAGLDYRQNPR